MEPCIRWVQVPSMEWEILGDDDGVFLHATQQRSEWPLTSGFPRTLSTNPVRCGLSSNYSDHSLLYCRSLSTVTSLRCGFMYNYCIVLHVYNCTWNRGIVRNWSVMCCVARIRMSAVQWHGTTGSSLHVRLQYVSCSLSLSLSMRVCVCLSLFM